MRINNNLMAVNAHRQLGINTRDQSKSIEKLSSGFRINRAGDDAAGLAISEKMRSQIRGLNKASRNAQDDISLIQTTEGALSETHAIIHRMREMAVQSSNDSNTDADRSALQAEMDQLAREITRIANDTEFNTRKILNGNLDSEVSGSTGDLTFHIGANTNQNMKFGVKAMDAFSLGLTRDVETFKGELAAGADTVNINGVKIGEPKGEAVINGAEVTVTVKAHEDTVVTKAATKAFAVGHEALAEETDIAGGANQIKIAVDGGGDVEITLSNGKYTRQGMVDEINAKINDNADLKGKVVASLNSENKLVFRAITEKVGEDSKIELKAGTADGTAALKITNGALGEKKGTKEVTAQKPNGRFDVVFEDGSGHTSITENVAYDASIVKGSGHFAGLELEIGDASLSAATKTKVTVSSITEKASKTEFTPGLQGSVTKAAFTAGGIDIRTQKDANGAIEAIDNALKRVSDVRAGLGAVQNRLEHTIKNVDTAAENLQASESRIRDVDMAKEMMNFTKNNILSQAAQAMLAQANQLPQGVLQLLR